MKRGLVDDSSALSPNCSGLLAVALGAIVASGLGLVNQRLLRSPKDRFVF